MSVVNEARPKSDPAGDTDRLISGFTPDEREAYQRFAKHEAAGRRQDLQHTWACGELLKGISDEVNRYRSGFVNLVAGLFDHSESWVRDRITFFRLFTAEDLQRLLQLRKAATGAPLTWTDVRSTFTVADPAERWRLLERCCSDGLCLADMAAAAQAAPSSKSDGRRGTTGRHPKIPSHVAGQLQMVCDFSAPAAKKLEALAVPETGLLPTVRALSPDSYTPSLLSQMTRGLEYLTRLGEAVDDMREQLTEAVAHVQKAGARRGRQAAAAAAGDDLFEDGGRP